MRRVRGNLLTVLSVLFFCATAACWLTGALRGRHATVWAVRPRPERTYFVRFGRQHLIVSDQQMMPAGMPAGYVTHCSHFREYRVFGPLFPNGAGTELSEEHFVLNPAGAWFRKIRLGHGGVVVGDGRGGVAWQVRSSYGAVEIPWWSLLVLFSLWPAHRGLSRFRRRSNVRRGLCPDCSYDLRATPGRCPECGAVAATAGTGTS